MGHNGYMRGVCTGGEIYINMLHGTNSPLLYSNGQNSKPPLAVRNRLTITLMRCTWVVDVEAAYSVTGRAWHYGLS